MNRARSAKGAQAIREQIALAPLEWALFLDLDGTLLDIAERPDGVVVPAGLVADLARIRIGLSGALAIVTGRPLADVDRFLHPLRLDSAAEHGSKMRLAESEDEGAVPIVAGIAPEIVDAIERAARAFEGVHIERKETAVSVHYRAAPGSGGALSRRLDNVLETTGADLRILSGRYVFEFVPSRASKARAVEALMSSSKFTGRAPVFIGDDASDEEACGLVEKKGGAALPVAGEHFSPERAAFHSPGHVRGWISELAEDLRWAAVAERGR